MRLTDASMETVAYYAIDNNEVGLQNIFDVATNDNIEALIFLVI